VESLVYEFLTLACDAILRDRKGIINPLTLQMNTADQNIDYCKLLISAWRKDVYKPFALDISMTDVLTGSDILLESWKITYTKNKDLKDPRPYAFINRRISTLVRTLNCFIRLLPSYTLINSSGKTLDMSVQIYDYKQERNLDFEHTCSEYRFPAVSTTKGLISMSVTYLNNASLKVTMLYSGYNSISRSLLFGLQSVLKTASCGKSSSTPIPIPSSSQPPHLLRVPEALKRPPQRHCRSLDAAQKLGPAGPKKSFSQPPSHGSSQPSTSQSSPPFAAPPLVPYPYYPNPYSP
jgi:hypothetical protein